MKCNTMRPAAQRYASRMGIVQKAGELAFLMSIAKSFDLVRVHARPAVEPVVVPMRSKTIFEIAMESRRG